MTEQDRIVVVTDSRLPTDHFILLGIDTSREPIYTVSEVGKMFFARSAHWMRWRERKGYFTLDGEGIAGTRTEGGARRYTLSDIEKMSHALATSGAIDGTQLGIALLLVQTEAQLYGYL